MIKEYKVLDKGYVKYIDHMGNDNSALIAARMSTDNPTGVDEKKDDNLRTRLWEDQHSSPFEMAELVVELKIPLVCLRQLDRHRTISYGVDGLEPIESVDDIARKFLSRNEFSGRYSVMMDEFYIPVVGRVMGKDPNNKQASYGALDQKTQEYVVQEIANISDTIRQVYEKFIALGVANELARIILPLNVYTKIQLKGSLLNWLKLLKLRLADDVQPETREITEAIANVVKELWPKSYAVFEEHTVHAKSLSKSELAILQELMLGADKPFLTKAKDALGVKRYNKLMKKLGLT